MKHKANTPKTLLVAFILTGMALSGMAQRAPYAGQDTTVYGGKIWRDTIPLSEIKPFENLTKEGVDVLCADFTALCNSENANSDSIIARIENILDYFAKVLTNTSYYGYLKSTDVTNATVANLSIQSSGLLNYVKAKGLGTIGAALYTKYQPVVWSALPEELQDSFLSAIQQTPDQLALRTRESEILAQYNAASVQEIEVEIAGQTINFSNLDSLELNSETRQEAYLALWQEKNRIIGTIYLDLVKVRRQIAEASSVEYSNFLEYAYKEDQGRNYSPEELKVVHRFVQQYFTPFYEELNGVLSHESEFEDALIAKSSEDMVQKLAGVMDNTRELNLSEFKPAYDYLTQYGLYDIAGGNTREKIGYCTNFVYYNAPAIFINSDVHPSYNALFHEFGHYLDDYGSTRENALYGTSNSDLTEVPSMSFESLALRSELSTFTDVATVSGIEAVKVASNIIGYVLHQTLFDAFEQEVYAQTELSLEDLNNIYKRLYGLFLGTEAANKTNLQYQWVYMSHLFHHANYTISYTMSALPALNIWFESKDDFASAKQTYKTLLNNIKQGDYAVAMDSAGMLTPLDEELYLKLADKVDDMLENSPYRRTITATAGIGGTIFPNGTIRAQEGQSVKIKLKPDEGNTIASIVVDGDSIAIRDSLYLHTKYDRNIAVTFRQVQTGIGDKTIPEVLLYPNPATDWVTLKTPDGNAERYTLYNSFGQVLVSRPIVSKETKIDVSGYPNGIYVVEVEERKIKLIVNDR
ncbi:M3 family metallopeptidase [Sunxiuqinia indica]|uniref:M3 family metallopeptidase n=1 Tax=Sunxiuqinia indica TaxID=2692584 RepID=UPI0013584768|nr:M3 family metallopeptidase [Sunxiuqinia indica]